ncbi:branched-chain amino acid ABC transporter permease [Acuticoccus sediminis]|uniref:Branched-chain amino acid ABC transporter permease n=1 Tax=Acuticoccus sediminis TaxID=2184697 RepID=A0A8B2NQ51_9HYPH|nr:branched-chain amino acid ABC transporter permease [Acuticoccus sediminis]RAI02015.1 branched-chain amino acid ABC transporter permease [Acuticoccus sediminis]
MTTDRILLVLLLVFVVAAPFLFPMVTAAEMLVFALVAVATNIMVGYTGMLSFGQAMFFGSGAYASGLMLKAGLPLIVALPGAALVVMVLSMAVGFFCVRRTGLYFICLTFAFNQMFYFIAYIWTGVTGGEDGLPGIPRPEFIATPMAFYVFTAVVLLASLLVIWRILHAPLGLVFRLIRENPSRTAAVGYDVRRFRWYAFVISSTFTGLAGGVYAMLYGIVPIDQIHWLRSGDFIFMLLFGGSGNFFGPVIGAVAYIFLSDTLAVIWARWLLVLGIIFAITVLFFRGGIVGLVETVAAKLTGRRAGEAEATR